MKKLCCALVAMVMVLGLAMVGSVAETADFGDVANDPQVTLTYAEVNPLDSIVGQTGTAFKEKVEELSGGSIIIDIQASGVLGSENDVLDSMLAGGDTIDMSRISAFALTSYGCNKSKLLSIPYTFANRQHFWNFANSDLASAFLSEPEELGLGIRGIFYGEEGFRHFFTKEAVNSIEDLAGLKLRVSNDPRYDRHGFRPGRQRYRCCVQRAVLCVADRRCRRRRAAHCQLQIQGFLRSCSQHDPRRPHTWRGSGGYLRCKLEQAYREPAECDHGRWRLRAGFQTPHFPSLKSRKYWKS